MTRWRSASVLCVWLVLCVSLVASNARPAVLVLGGIVAAVAAAILVLLDVATLAIRVEWISPRRLPRSRRGSDPRVGSLHQQLHDARWFDSTELRATLVELVDDRLLAHRHIDRSADAEAAMRALTPELRQLVAGSRWSALGPRQLSRLVAAIEAL